MTEAESPGAVAALGASKIDQIGGKVDPENSPHGLITQPLLRAGIQKNSALPKTTRTQSPPCSRTSFVAAMME